MLSLRTSLLTALVVGALAAPEQTAAQAARATTKPATTTATKTAARPAAKPAAKTAARPAAAPSPAPAPAPAPAPPPAPVMAASSSSSGSGGMGMSARNDSFRKGTTAANLGIGLIHFGSYSGLLFSGSGYSRTPLINLSVEHGIVDDLGPGVLSIGGIVGFRRASYTFNGGFIGYGYKWAATDVFVGARGIYHYQLSSNPKLDTYGGLTVGVRISKYSYTWNDDVPSEYRTSTTDSYTNLFSGLFVGARYNFAQNLGVFGEFGYDISLLKVGLSAKF